MNICAWARILVNWFWTVGWDECSPNRHDDIIRGKPFTPPIDLEASLHAFTVS